MARRWMRADRGTGGTERLWSTCWREPCWRGDFARSDFRLVILAKVHARVEAGDLVAVAIEQQSLVRLEKFREAAFASLAPARMVDFGIHVGVEAVLLRGIKIPRSGRLVFDEADFHQRLDALESILPRDDHAHGSAVLIGQGFAI